MIPPLQSGDFVAAMEAVLAVYCRPFDRHWPVVCMDESPKQLIAEVRQAVPAASGRPAREDFEYRRCGVANIFLACDPLAGTRYVEVRERKTKQDFAQFLAAVAARYPTAEKITLVSDNLNTHGPGALYETFAPAQARALLERFELVHTPKHGSWLNMAEIELRVLMGQCLSGRLDAIERVRAAATAWQEERNHATAKINWRFTTDNARIKLRRLYPTIDASVHV